MDKRVIAGEILLEIRELDKRLQDLERKLDEYLALPDVSPMAYAAQEEPPCPRAERVSAPGPEPVKAAAAPEPVRESPAAAEPVQAKPVAEVVSPSVPRDGRCIADLRKAIGLNDRFRFLNGLFGGDSALMSETVEAVNALSSFREAEAYLKSRFGWNPDDETAAYFMDMLRKRFPNG